MIWCYNSWSNGVSCKFLTLQYTSNFMQIFQNRLVMSWNMIFCFFFCLPRLLAEQHFFFAWYHYSIVAVLLYDEADGSLSFMDYVLSYFLLSSAKLCWHFPSSVNKFSSSHLLLYISLIKIPLHTAKRKSYFYRKYNK